MEAVVALIALGIGSLMTFFGIVDHRPAEYGMAYIGVVLIAAAMVSLAILRAAQIRRDAGAPRGGEPEDNKRG